MVKTHRKCITFVLQFEAIHNKDYSVVNHLLGGAARLLPFFVFMAEQ